MKTATLLIVSTMSIFGCQTAPRKMEQALIGKTIEYRYGENIYHVLLDTDSTLHWEAKAGDEIGARESETYVAEWIDPQKLFITWGEANGIGVSQVLDFERGQVYNHLLRGREATMGTGEIRILN
jgi:hypothetical protein